MGGGNFVDAGKLHKVVENGEYLGSTGYCLLNSQLNYDELYDFYNDNYSPNKYTPFLIIEYNNNIPGPNYSLGDYKDGKLIISSISKDKINFEPIWIYKMANKDGFYSEYGYGNVRSPIGKITWLLKSDHSQLDIDIYKIAVDMDVVDPLLDIYGDHNVNIYVGIDRVDKWMQYVVNIE